MDDLVCNINTKMEKSVKRRNKWKPVAERAMIDIWKNNLERLQGTSKRNHIFAEMAAELCELGYPCTPIGIKFKMHNLSSRYRKEKNLCEEGQTTSDWMFYKDMQFLKQSSRREQKSEYSIKDFPELSSSSSEIPAPTSPTYRISTASRSSSVLPLPLAQTPPLVAQLNKKESVLLDFFKKTDEDMERIHNEIVETCFSVKEMAEKIVSIEKQKADILKKYEEREAEVQNALINFLKSNS